MNALKLKVRQTGSSVPGSKRIYGAVAAAGLLPRRLPGLQALLQPGHPERAAGKLTRSRATDRVASTSGALGGKREHSHATFTHAAEGILLVPDSPNRGTSPMKPVFLCC